jgi:hypothetical protein
VVRKATRKIKNYLIKYLGLYQAEVSVDISFTAFFTAVTLFFTGLLLKDFKELSLKYTSFIEIPIIFLILSVSGFLYSTLIYANATGKFLKIASKRFAKRILNKSEFERCILLGTTISEYLGVYFLILSIPLTINAISDILFLRVIVLIMILLGLWFYHASGFCVMKRHFKKHHFTFLSFIFILETAIFLGQILKNSIIAYISCFLLIFLILSLASYIFINSKKIIENLEKKKTFGL